MKHAVIALLATLSLSVPALAQETVILPAKNGNVTFPHKKHQEVKKDCTPCHDSVKGGQIAGLGKDWAHKTCKGCHEDMKKGPTKCVECHKK